MKTYKFNAVTRVIVLLLVFSMFLALSSCETNLDLNAEKKQATDKTKATNNEVYDLLDFDDRQEFEFAQKGLLEAPEELEIFDDENNLIWSQKALAFVKDTEAADTANPSLWRNTQLNHFYGLFEVTDGIYQVRGYDLTNLTVIEGKTGWIIFDPLSSVETAQASLKLVNDTLGERPVTGIVISHPHGDHFSGIKGVITEEEIIEREIPIIVPEHFEEHAVVEYLYAGNAMNRRADIQYGSHLEFNAQERLAIGLGLKIPTGTGSYISPNKLIIKTGEKHEIDGVNMEFQMTPGTEAPAEMNTWFPDKKALWMAENCNATLHNLYTLRGAQVRDGNAWARYIMEAVTLYGDKAEVIFTAHNWPRWENKVINEYLTNTAAVYKFINDQTLMYINQGYTSNEISNMIKLPDDLEKIWYTRPYYGTVRHNAKGVYQRYMGWYDANPVNLNPLAPTDSAKKFVEYLGDSKKVLEKAYSDFEKGEYQWVAEITRVLIYADPNNKDARYLCADALEQLGYQAESGTWRASYLSAAKELREGKPETPGISGAKSGDMLRHLEPYMVFDYMNISMDSNKAQNLNLKINVNVVNDDSYLLTVNSGVILYQKGITDKNANVTLTLPKQAIALLMAPEGLENEAVQFEGNKEEFMQLYENMVEFDPNFSVIEPK